MSKKQLKQAMPTQSTIMRTDNEAEELRLSIYDDLINNLTIQIHAAKVNAVKLKSVDKGKAVLFLRKARQLETQQELLKKARDDPSKPEPPEFKREKRVTKKEINFPDIGPKVVRIRVESVSDLFPACGSACPTYLHLDFRFTDSSSPITGTSGTLGGTPSPEYKHDFEIPIERTKLYAKYFERKKIPFVIYHKRPLLKDVPIARFEVPLAQMLNKAEVLMDCPVVCGSSKRPSASTVAKVVLRIRTPLLGRDIVETVEEDLIITSPIFGAPEPQSSPSPTATSPAPAPQSEPQKAPQKQAQEPSPAPAPQSEPQKAPQKQAQEPQPVAKAASTKPAAAGAPQGGSEEGGLSQEEMDALRDECYDLKRYFSCELCDWEIARLQKEMAALRAAKKPTEEVADRISAVEMQSQSLVIMVQTGKLTMEGYLENLNKLLNNEKALFKKVLQAKMVAEAKIVKARIAVLTAEIQSANEE